MTRPTFTESPPPSGELSAYAFHRSLTDAFRAKLEDGMSDEMAERAAKKVRDALTEELDAFHWAIKDDLSGYIADAVQGIAQNVVEAILDGNDALMRRYLTCETGRYTGRDEVRTDWTGAIFASPAMDLRAKIVAAHRDLLTDERIADVEAEKAALKVHIDKQTKRIIALRQAMSNAITMGAVAPLQTALDGDRL